MTVKPGRESSEHWRAWRSEAVGVCLVLAGLVLAFVDRLAGIALCGIGAWLLRGVATGYSDSRATVKAAAQRRPADQAPPRV